MIFALLKNAPGDPHLEKNLGQLLTETMTNPGSLFRAQLMYQTALACRHTEEFALDLACAVEYFHSASLLLDDMPFMDDATQRRGRVCPHLLHGEETVMLGALGLIARAYALVGKSLSGFPTTLQQQAHTLVERCMGIAGILNGQAHDLQFRSSKASRRDCQAIALAKTGSLLKLCLVLPALVARQPELIMLNQRRLSVYWGLLYQAMDDAKDIWAGVVPTGKSSGRDQSLGRPNVVRHRGVEAAIHDMRRLGSLGQGSVESMIRVESAFSFLEPFQAFLLGRLEEVILHGGNASGAGAA
jgi:geranylgeranyl pyrophosphate synthase